MRTIFFNLPFGSGWVGSFIVTENFCAHMLVYYLLVVRYPHGCAAPAAAHAHTAQPEPSIRVPTEKRGDGRTESELSLFRRQIYSYGDASYGLVGQSGPPPGHAPGPHLIKYQDRKGHDSSGCVSTPSRRRASALSNHIRWRLAPLALRTRRQQPTWEVGRSVSAY